jgi:hypothetical protein
MTVKKIIVAMALVVGATSAALAQSAYTSGTIASSERAGYPSVGGYGSGLYAYAPGYGYGYGHAAGDREVTHGNLLRTRRP